MFYQKSIVWKLALPLPIMLVCCVLVAWTLIPQMVTDNAREAAERSAVQTVKQFKTIRGYYTKNVIKKVKANGALKPSFNHATEPNTVPLPATLIHDLSALMAEEDTSIALYSAFPFPLRKDRVLDGFQAEAWAYLNQNPKGTFTREETRGDKRVLRVAMADTMAAEGCVKCHNNHPETPKADWKLGDVRGVLEVATNIEPAIAAASSVSTKVVLGMMIAGAVLIALIILGARAVARPITRLTESMKLLAEGDPSAEIPDDDRLDEVGQMTGAVMVFRDNAVERARLEAESGRDEAANQERQSRIDGLIATFRETATTNIQEVSTNTAQMEATANALSETANITSDQASTAASASNEALQNVQAVSAAAEELASSVEEISRQVARTNDVVNKATEATETTNQKVSGLTDAAQRIGDVVSLIQAIAEQTNLLALNATIEAARAGDAGRGFAVVASEVKELATQTGKATEDIAEHIASIQSETQGSVLAIREIATIMHDVKESTASIAAALEQQGASTGEIARNVQEAASGSGTVSQSVTGVTSAAAETSQAAAQMLSATSEVRHRAEELRGVVDDFLERVAST